MSLFLRAVPAIFVLLWSTGFIGSKLGAPYAEPFTFLVLRYVAVLVLLALMMVALKPDRGLTLVERGHAMVVGILIHGVYLGAVFWAIDNDMPAGVAALIVGLQPLVTTICAGVLLGERMSVLHWVGMAIGLVGVGLVVAPRIGIDGAGIDAATITACAIGVLGMTFGTVYQKRFAQQMEMRTCVLYQYVGALAITLVAALLVEDFRVEWTGQFIFALGWLVIVLSLGAISLLMLLIRAGEVSRVASLFYLAPVATAIESYFLFGEELEIIQLVGMVIVIGAVALVTRGRSGATRAGAT